MKQIKKYYFLGLITLYNLVVAMLLVILGLVFKAPWMYGLLVITIPCVIFPVILTIKKIKLNET